MSAIDKDLGMATAYAYAVSRGYTGTEEEFAQYIANVGQTAQAAAESAESAARSATTAGQSAESAAQSALEVSGAVTDAEAAATAAGESEAAAVESAADAETEALKSEGHAVGKQDGVDVDAQSEYYQNNSKYYSDRAKDIYDDAVEVRDSIPADYSNLSRDVTDLKADLSEIKPIVTEEVASTNVFTPISTRIYPDSGTAVINDDKSITITDVPRLSTVWIYAQDGDPITLEAGEYTLCIDNGLYVYGKNSISLQVKIGTNAYTDIVSATVEQTQFTLSEDTTGLFRINYVATGAEYTTNWSGHIWINKGEAQPYMPVGARELLPKEFVDADQGEENSGKILSVDNNGKVYLIDNPLGAVVSDEIYQKGNLLKWDSVTKGYIKADGTVQPYNSLWCSDFCEIEEGKVYCNAVSGNINVNQYFAFYDENKTFLASYQTIGSMQRLTSDIRYLSVPEGAKYFRCTFSVDQAVNRTAWISNSPENPYENDSYNVKDVYPYVFNPENPCDYSELTVRAFSKVVCIGDSLTYGGFNLSNDGPSTGETQSSAELALRYSYPSNFQRITGVETVNAGDSGETSVSWYQQHKNDDFSQFDLAIIHLGVNDSAFSVSDADTLTAMQNIVTMLNNARSDMRIAICSVIPAYDGTGYQAKGQLILNWAKGLNNPNVIPLDIARYSHVKPRTSYVAGHLSALGYYMMAYDIARYISWYMDQHKRDFRFIQFIGSPDAVYDYD
jgi:lysophospholipase L1-like esterase